jgi:hypothetical protein
MHFDFRAPALAALLAACSGCAFHSTATHWNGRTDPEGRPMFVKTTTNLGINVAVILPLLGNTSIDAMLDETTGEIARKEGNRLRIIQTSSENYWYGFPPFTWILTPVITDVAVAYEPSAQELVEAEQASRKMAAATRARAEGDNAHVLPDRKR